MVVGSATVKPGGIGIIKVSVIMHDGMEGPHLFHIFIKSSDPQNRITILKVKANIVPLETWRRSHPGAFYLPREVANLPLRSETVGSDAIAFARQALGSSGQLRHAYVGQYIQKKQAVRLLVSEYADAAEAKHLLFRRATRLEQQAGNPYLFREIAVQGNTVYEVKNKAHRFFSFQRGNKVIWLLPDDAVARQALEEVIQHMQTQGS